MKMSLIAVGKNAPEWLEKGYQNYSKRLPPEIGFKLIEIDAVPRTKNQPIMPALKQEGERIVRKIPPQSLVVACDEHGELWDTITLAEKLKQWRQTEQHVCFLIGGTDGYAPDCLQKANSCWSLSRLTFPHFLVRLIVVEQLYRATTILTGHPYHRPNIQT